MPTDIRHPDRRDYYRIEDHVGLEYRLVPRHAPTGTSLFDGDHLDGLKSELKRLDLELRTQLSTLAERDRLLAAVVKTLNSKVDTLARIMAFEQNPLQPQDWQDVTLSEGGISFLVSDGALTTGDQIALRLTLPPELFQPTAQAEILTTEPAPSGQVKVHTAFTVIHDADRQQIAKHVMRWQIRQRHGGDPSQ